MRSEEEVEAKLKELRSLEYGENNFYTVTGNALDWIDCLQWVLKKE